MKECDWCYEEHPSKMFSLSLRDVDFEERVCNECYGEHWDDNGVQTITRDQYRYKNPKRKEYQSHGIRLIHMPWLWLVLAGIND